MAMTVDPGGAYFWFYSDYGDVKRGEIITYGSAVASATASGARDVADIAIPGDLGSPTILVGHPKLIGANGTETNIEIRTTYDNGFWGDGTPPWEPSKFLVELQGPGAAGFVVGDSVGPLSIYHYVSTGEVHVISLSASGGASLFDSLTRIKIWRAAVFPAPFWTDFVGTREIV